ncbi:polysaccharide deacetylase family protein [Carboxylicivirga sp. RSCT41]|uniref:polysaccharide deacetylase family protein n=1 Tax=Carboxylicivirga agarovorans TaxID=3417570 RepID=UPI003D32F9DA
MSKTSVAIISLLSLLTVVFIAIIVLGVSVMRLNLFIRSVSELKTQNREIAITFDDGPCPERTPQILDILARYQAKATFFSIGNKLEENAEIAKRIIAEGHSIANHSYEHAPVFPVWSVKRIRESILKTDKALINLGIEPGNMFRPPYGVTNNLVAAAVRSLKKDCIGWSIRTKDTCRSPEQVIAMVKKNVKPGSIIILHDTNKYVCEELEAILKYCQANQLNSIALT